MWLTFVSAVKGDGRIFFLKESEYGRLFGSKLNGLYLKTIDNDPVSTTIERWITLITWFFRIYSDLNNDSEVGWSDRFYDDICPTTK